METNELESQVTTPAQGHNSLVVILISVVMALAGAGMVLGYLIVSQPALLSDNTEDTDTDANDTSSSTQPEVPPGYDFPDQGRAKTVTYAEPDPEVFSDLDFPEYDPSKVATPGTVKIDFPNSIASGDFQGNFNNLVNAALLVEDHMAKKVAPAMAEVQQKAAAGLYLEMFEVMLVAKESNRTGRDLSESLLAETAAFSAVVATQTDSEVQNRANTLAAATEKYANLNTELMNLNDGVLIGSIPSQAELDAIQTTATEMAQANAEVASAIKALSDYVTGKVKSTPQ